MASVVKRGRRMNKERRILLRIAMVSVKMVHQLDGFEAFIQDMAWEIDVIMKDISFVDILFISSRVKYYLNL